jgi:hypothetical protein
MKIGSRSLFIAGCILLLTGVSVWLNYHGRPSQVVRNVQVPQETGTAPDPTNPATPLVTPQQAKSGFEALSEAERDQLKEKLNAEFRPALDRWCSAYAGHVPFRPDALSPQDLRDKVGRGDYYHCYVFVLNGMTIGMEERNGAAQVAYLNTPETKKLIDLPQGQAPDVREPITAEEVASMVKQDSGKDFPRNEIRIVPTAVSSSMQGGAHVMVGGDPSNPVTWNYTLTFGPDKMLTYYLKGNAH